MAGDGGKWWRQRACVFQQLKEADDGGMERCGQSRHQGTICVQMDQSDKVNKKN